MKIRHPARWSLSAAGLVSLGLGALLLRPVPAAPAPPADADAGFARWRGVASCTSSGCHNQDSGSAAYARGSEYAVWASHDPHSRAFQVLFDARSVRIQKNLDHADPSKAPIPPEQNLLCIRCHVDPRAEAVAEAKPVWFSDGVGCESCHGPAGRWLTMHFSGQWQGMTAKQKESLGFNDITDLRKRAQVCTDCHVGGDRAEVNHDLIAAGHPALLFENSSFLDRYRPYQHWSEAEDRRRHPALEAEEWAVGQAVSAEAGLKLLAARAEAAKPPDVRPWPEFAEYDCASCHHDLRPQTQFAGEGHKSGLPAWSWYTAVAPLPPAHGGPAPATLLRQLRAVMETRNPPRAEVADKASKLVDAYHEWLNEPAVASAHRDDPRAALLRLTGPEGEEVARGGWEDARQLSFAIAAYQRALETAEPEPRRSQVVSSLMELLRLPPGRDVPNTFSAEDVVSDLKKINKQLQQHPQD